MRLEIGLNRKTGGTYLVRHLVVDLADFDARFASPVQSPRGREAHGTTQSRTVRRRRVRLGPGIPVEECRADADEELIRVPISWEDAERLGF
jgi:hypothetical protein